MCTGVLLYERERERESGAACVVLVDKLLLCVVCSASSVLLAGRMAGSDRLVVNSCLPRRRYYRRCYC